MSETMNFDMNSQLSLSQGEPWYQVFNYKKTEGGTFDLVKVNKYSSIYSHRYDVFFLNKIHIFCLPFPRIQLVRNVIFH